MFAGYGCLVLVVLFAVWKTRVVVGFAAAGSWLKGVLAVVRVGAAK